ncbi:hypothetical protein P4O66_017633, partial [Electrophorus voltai]
MDEYKCAAYGVRRAVRDAKRRYERKLETQFQQSGSRSLWQGLRTITDYRSPPSGLMSADESLANELNTFFARFETTSSSANANTANANSASANGNGTICTANGGGTRRYLRESPQSLRRPASTGIHRHLQSLPDARCRPVQLQAIHPRPRPEETSTSGLNDYRPVAALLISHRPQSVRVGNCASSTLTLSTGAPQGCVLSPLLYSLYTYDCTATSSSTIIVKFADDTVVMGLISDNDERAYLEEIKHLENWKKQEQHYQPVRISGTTVERVDSFRYLGVHISQDLAWSRHTNSLAKKACQRLYHLRRLRDFRLPSKVLRNFYTCTIESILTGNITVWFGNSTKQDRQALQRVVRSAERITHMKLPDLQTIYYKWCQTKARRIVKDPTHPNNRLFSLL